MSLLGKLKSLFGKDSPDSEESRDTSVTIEREPDTPQDPGTGDESESSDQSPQAVDPDADDPEPDETADEPTDAASEPVEQRPTDENAGGTPLEEIKGIGPTYADRIGEAGIDSVEELAKADPEALAEETGISETRLENWVERAKLR